MPKYLITMQIAIEAPNKEEAEEKTSEILELTKINEIEEYCINNGINLSKYFLQLHYVEREKFARREEHQEKGGQWKEELEANELASTSTTGMPDKFMKKKNGKKKNTFFCRSAKKRIIICQKNSDPQTRR